MGANRNISYNADPAPRYRVTQREDAAGRYLPGRNGIQKYRRTGGIDEGMDSIKEDLNEPQVNMNVL